MKAQRSASIDLLGSKSKSTELLSKKESKQEKGSSSNLLKEKSPSKSLQILFPNNIEIGNTNARLMSTDAVYQKGSSSIAPADEIKTSKVENGSVIFLPLNDVVLVPLKGSVEDIQNVNIPQVNIEPHIELEEKPINHSMDILNWNDVDTERRETGIMGSLDVLGSNIKATSLNCFHIFYT